MKMIQEKSGIINVHEALVNPNHGLSTFCPYKPQLSVVFTTHQEKFSLQLTKATTENHGQSKYRFMGSNPKG